MREGRKTSHWDVGSSLCPFKLEQLLRVRLREMFTFES
jgi:hypothetical protein